MADDDGDDDEIGGVSRKSAAADSNVDLENANEFSSDPNAEPEATSDNASLQRVRPPASDRQHLGNHRQYWRDIILGVNDGLVSTFLLVAGVAGGGLSSSAIFLTAVAGAVAGAVSMCAGEYIATKSQNQVLEGEIALERLHVAHATEDELSEVGDLLDLIGISGTEGDLRSVILEHYKRNPDRLLKLMVALEFGVLDQEQRSPMRAGLISCGVFVLGSLPSVIPFSFSGDMPLMGLLIAAVATVVSLLAVGAVKTWATRGNWAVSALENLIIASVGGSLAYGIGALVEMTSGNHVPA